MTPLALAAWFIWSSSAIAVPALLPPQPHPTTNITCIPRERDALLAFKAGLTDPSNYLSSWRLEDDCCWWPGVECSYRTGHVVGLDVNSGLDSYDEIVPGAIGGQISSSLLTLRHLKHLDLSYNNFSGSPIPEFIGGLRSLKHLALTGSSFGGRIPPHLGNLSHLVSLDLSFQLHGFCSPDLTWLSRLRKLQYLDMSEVDLSANVNWADVVNMLPSLLLQYVPIEPASRAGNLDIDGSNDTNELCWLLKFKACIAEATTQKYRTQYADYTSSPLPKMARPRPPIQATAILLATWCLVFLRSSSAPAVPALRPPSAPGGTLCIPHERDALLAFKAGLTDPTNYLSSWRAEEDCCRWMGVGCSNRTGHIIKLQVNSYGAIGGEINSSLLTLRHLKHLDLSSNCFGGRPIPQFIGSFSSLTHLLLGDSSFGGRIPPHLGNLSNLCYLS
ncbi:hypothetical protein ZWY2020_018746 [Hordeum vulgare]|nr:hypothetical protein ZWY2020_018746 [Hordeum vulgare]